jgi:hypothetical protein
VDFFYFYFFWGVGCVYGGEWVEKAIARTDVILPHGRGAEFRCRGNGGRRAAGGGQRAVGCGQRVTALRAERRRRLAGRNGDG